MKILAIAASNNRQSINRVLATYAAGLIDDASVEVIDIADYEMPIYSDEREQAQGQPPQARAFQQKIAEADALIVSFAEHNGSYTAAWKNLFDWTSRIDTRVYQDKPALFLATSPGPGGASTVLAAAVGSAPYFGGHVVSSLSVHSFHDNFDLGANELVHRGIQKRLRRAVRRLENAGQRRIAEEREAA